MYNPIEMAKRIDDIIRIKNLSYEKLAELSDVSIDTLEKIMTGQCGDLKISHVIKIADVLDVTTDCLILGRGFSVEAISDAGIQVSDDLYDDFYNLLVKYAFINNGDDLSDKQADILIGIIRIINAAF